MNSSSTSLSGTIPTKCVMFKLLGGKLDDTTTEAYTVLIFLVVLSIITCPLTTLFNVLVMIAVKTKPRLKTNSNIVLGCLAVTDGLIGVIGIPWFVAIRISTLKGEASEEYCFLEQLTRNIIRLLCSASITHLLLMSVERYIAIKHSFAYTTVVTKTRILAASALGWFIALVATIPLVITDNKMYLTTNNTLLILFAAIIISCQVAVYVEIRRHQKQIASHQVSEEAKQKFLREKKALKLTTCVILLLLLSYLPIFVVRTLLVTSTITNKNIAYISVYTASFATILNSLMNPVVYCVRIRQFRVALIEILFRKRYTGSRHAEQFERRRVFGTLNNVVPLEKTTQTTTTTAEATKALTELGRLTVKIFCNDINNRNTDGNQIDDTILQ